MLSSSTDMPSTIMHSFDHRPVSRDLRHGLLLDLFQIKKAADILDIFVTKLFIRAPIADSSLPNEAEIVVIPIFSFADQCRIN